MVGWFLVAAGLPVATCLLLVLRRNLDNWMTAALLVVGTFGGIFSAFVGAWTIYSFWSIVAILACIAWAWVVALPRMRRNAWKAPGIATGLIGGALMGVGSCFFFLDVQAVRAMYPPAATVDLSFPFEQGTFAVSQGGSGPPLQMAHRSSPATRYAIDMTMINAAGISRSEFAVTDQQAWLIWDKAVLSPCSGEVVWARDGIADRISIDTVTPAGNVVAIECEGVIVYLAHLREGTVTVRSGDAVTDGQRLGSIGTSGNSGGPHLHIHAEKPPFGGELSENDGIGITFDGRFLWKPRLVTVD